MVLPAPPAPSNATDDEKEWCYCKKYCSRPGGRYLHTRTVRRHRSEAKRVARERDRRTQRPSNSDNSGAAAASSSSPRSKRMRRDTSDSNNSDAPDASTSRQNEHDIESSTPYDDSDGPPASYSPTMAHTLPTAVVAHVSPATASPTSPTLATPGSTGPAASNARCDADVDPGSLADTHSEPDQGFLPPDPAANSPDPTPMPEPSVIEDVRLAEEYIQALRNADLANGDMSAEDIERLLNPPQTTVEFDEDKDRALLLSLRQFLAHIGSSEDTYRNSIASIRQACPNLELYSLERIKKYIAELTGVVPIVNDMCPNSCHAYTGPLATRTTCLKCAHPRYDAFGKPLQRFYTLPPTAVLQSMHRDPKLCHEFGYASRKFDAIIEEMRRTGAISEYDDILCGSDILDAFLRGRIRRSDMLLMLSLDGAQIYQDKQSDCWIYIWVFTSLWPDLRYKKRYVVPGGFIPGPHKPKIMDSYLFPGLHHIAALNKRGGLPIWNALLRRIIVSRLFILLAGGDGPAITHLNGLVGTAGRRACRFRCGLKGRRKPTGQAGHHYPCLSLPDNYTVVDCDHPDILPTDIPSPWLNNYVLQLEEVRQSSTQNEYKARRAETGICKPSILSGLEPCILGVPRMFPGDIMHVVLNLGDLLIPLWRGKFERAEGDPLASWDWAVLKGETWEQYGREVAASTPYMPGSFDRPPRNPAEKINSGYKAWEYLFLLFGLGPGQLLNVLPDAYWESFCKLARGMQILYQYETPYSDVKEMHSCLIGFLADYEAQYVRKMPERVHFVRQSIHILSHFAPELLRIGPGICSSQWTMERCIGNLTEEIRQHSTFYANLSERGVERCRVNALCAMVPQIVPETERERGLPRGARDAGGGYVFLRARSTRFAPSPSERAALLRYLLAEKCNIPFDWEAKLRLVKWARLRLPNSQIARSAWKESLKPLHKVRMSRNVKFVANKRHEFAEVYYYFIYTAGGKERMLCMGSLYTRPDEDLYRRSSGALWSCSPQGDDGLAVFDVHTISSVVAMVPHSTYFCGPAFANRVFTVEKPGLSAATLGGVVEEDIETHRDDDPDETA